MSTSVGSYSRPNRYRELLGEQRTARIAARAEEIGATLAGRDDRWLRLVRGVLDDPLDALDRDGAKEALAVERMRPMAEETLVKARARKGIAALESISHRPAGAAERGEEAARQVASSERRLRELDAREAELRAAGTHPEDWMARDGERAARVLAFGREIRERAGRRPLDNGRARWDSRVADPLHPYRDALGPEVERRAEPLKKVMARQDGTALTTWRGELGRPQETMRGVDHAEAGRLRKDREALERRTLDLETQAEQLEATGYKPELAATLRYEHGRRVERLQEVQQRQQSLWESRREVGEAWLRRHGDRAALSVAVETQLVGQVEQQMQQRELSDGGYSY
jgi:hypothetical protein